MAGYTKSFGGYYEVLIIKMNSSGAIQWAEVIGGIFVDEAYFVQQTTDGGYIVVGDTRSYGAGYYDALIIKLDSSGLVEWAKAIGGTNYDFGESIQQTSDGGYIVAGYTDSYGAGSYDVLIIKLNSTGLIEWAKAIGGASSDYTYSIEPVSDGGYIVAGYTSSYGAGWSDALIIKLDSTGAIQWAKAIGASLSDYASFVQPTSDGGYIVTGYTSSYGAGGDDALVLRLDKDGNISGCSLILDISPTVTDITPTQTTITPTVTSISPTVTSITPTVTSITPTVTTVCSSPGFSLTPIVTTSTSRVGINNSSPTAGLTVGEGTVDYVSGLSDVYIGGDLELDGSAYFGGLLIWGAI